MSDYTIIQGTSSADPVVFKDNLSFVKGYITLYNYLDSYQLLESEEAISYMVLYKGDLADPALCHDTDIAVDSYLYRARQLLTILISFVDDVNAEDDDEEKEDKEERQLNKIGLSKKMVKILLRSIARYYIKYNIDVDIRVSDVVEQYIYCLVKLIGLREAAMNDVVNIRRVFRSLPNKEDLYGTNTDRRILNKMGIL